VRPAFSFTESFADVLHACSGEASTTLAQEKCEVKLRSCESLKFTCKRSWDGGDRRAAHEIDGDIGGALALAGDEFPVADGGGDGVDKDGVSAFDFDVFHGAVGGDGGLHLDGAADVHFLEDFGVGGYDFFQEARRLGLIFLWDDG
jgi:hypothetical protein